MLGSDPLEFHGVTYEGRKKKYNRVIHQKMCPEPLMIKQKSVLKNIEKCSNYSLKMLEIAFWRKNLFFQVFLAITWTFFNIFQNRFSLDHQWRKALLLMYNMTI